MSKIIELFYKNVDKNPSKTAIICEDERYSYKELEYFVNRFINNFVENKVQYGDNIGVLLPNNIDFVALMLAAAAIGAVITPLSTTLPNAVINQAFKFADVKHVVGTKATLDDLNLDISGHKLRLDGNILENENTQRYSSDKVTGREALIFTMTSGSTGEPKPIILSQQNKIDRAFAAAKIYSVDGEDVILAATPLYHSLAERLVLMPLLLGGTSVILPRFSPSVWLKAVKDCSVTFTIAVSSQLRQIAEVLASPYLPEINSLKCVVSSSALLEPHTKRELVAKLKCDFHECYGTSEIAIATNLNIIDSQEKMKSVGKAICGVDVKILKPDNKFAAVDEIGEIICKTPMLFMGYYKLPEKTKESMFGEYFKTGDMGKLDKDGFLYFIDRQKDLIISGGINIYPNDVEDVGGKYKDVIECAAFPYPDENLGEVVALAVVVKEGFELRKFKFHCANELADFQLPRKYFVVDELPRNNMGKLVKHKLVEMFAE